MTLPGQNTKSLLLLTLAVFITRLPFLFAGYGSEEDAWGLILTARNIDLTGIYEVSRMPGHPVQEVLLSLLWQLPAWLLNLLTACISTAGVYYFMLTLRLWDIRNYLLAGAALAFTPVFYINSTNVMDYTWALALIMISMNRLANGQVLFAAALLGLACGFRITAGAMVIPFAILLLKQPAPFKNIILLGSITALVALVSFIPAFQVYGTSFFTYYEYFPYPPFLKNIYKGTIGAWGLPGSIAVAAALVTSFAAWMKMDVEEKAKINPLLLMSAVTVLLYSYSFLRIPQKSAFVIPMIPFIIIIFSLLLSRKQLIGVTAAIIVSGFFLGINLSDQRRGSNASALAINATVGNTPIAIDPLVGIVTADYLKRKQKIAYAQQLVERMKNVTEKTVVIAGWWQNELNYFSMERANANVSYLYYADEKQLSDSIAAGNKIFYLPEQDYYNDLRFNGKFTNEIAASMDQLTVSDPL